MSPGENGVYRQPLIPDPPLPPPVVRAAAPAPPYRQPLIPDPPLPPPAPPAAVRAEPERKIRRSTRYSKLAAKLAAVRGDIEHLSADGRNAQRNYAYASAALLFNTIRPLLAKHGVNLLYTVGAATFEQLTTDSGKPFVLATVPLVFGLEDADDPNDWVEVDMIQMVVDYDLDKGINKALTNGLKYFLFTTFVTTGGRDDAEGNENRPAEGEGETVRRRRATGPAQADAPPEQQPDGIPPTEAKRLGPAFVGRMDRAMLTRTCADGQPLEWHHIAGELSRKYGEAPFDVPVVGWLPKFADEIVEIIRKAPRRTSSSTPTHTHTPQPASSAAPVRPTRATPWPEHERANANHVCYWRRRILAKFGEELAAAQHDPSTAEMYVRMLEDQACAPGAGTTPEPQAALVYRALWLKVQNGEITPFTVLPSAAPTPTTPSTAQPAPAARPEPVFVPDRNL